MKIKLNSRVLFEIINNTPSPKVAMQLIDGTYRRPKMPKEAMIEGQTMTMYHYDKWTDMVTYQCPDNTTNTISFTNWMEASKTEVEAKIAV